MRWLIPIIIFLYPSPSSRQFYDSTNSCLNDDNACDLPDSDFLDDSIDRPWQYWIEEELPYQLPEDLGYEEKSS